jgi:hypothetical protein
VLTILGIIGAILSPRHVTTLRGLKASKPPPQNLEGDVDKARVLTMQALDLLWQAAEMSHRPESDPIHVMVHEGHMTVFRHAKDGSVEAQHYVLPPSFPPHVRDEVVSMTIDGLISRDVQ